MALMLSLTPDLEALVCSVLGPSERGVLDIVVVIASGALLTLISGSLFLIVVRSEDVPDR